jgi:hypothetical protein
MLAQRRWIDTTTTYGGGLACLLCGASCAPQRPKTISNPSCIAMKPPSGRVVPCDTTLSRRSFVDLGWSCQGGRGRPLFSGNPWPGGRRSDERTRKADPGPGCARPLQSVAWTPRDPRGILASGYLPIALRLTDRLGSSIALFCKEITGLQPRSPIAAVLVSGFCGEIGAMMFPKWTSRRHILAATVLAPGPSRAFAQPRILTARLSWLP